MASTPSYPSTSEEVPCARHPKTLTRLRCSRCFKPICPACSARTPVGLRCPECAGVRALPTYTASPTVLAPAAGAALAIAAVIGIVWWQIPDWGFYLALILGFGVAETIARLTGDKRGRELQLIGMVAVAAALVLSRWLLFRDYGLSLAQIGDLPDYARAILHVKLVPDGIFALLPFLIVWYRFK